AIAHRLNSDGVPCFGKSKEWQRSYIVKLLRFKAVIGIYEAHRVIASRRQFEKEVPDYYPRVIEQSIWNRVQSLVRSHSPVRGRHTRSEEHTSELQSLAYLVCRLLLEKKK